MKTIQSRFGEITYDPADTLEMPKGLIGFEKLRRFVVMPKRKEGPLFWIQSAEDRDVAFLLSDPLDFFPGYRVVPDAQEREMLGIESGDECFALAVVTILPNQEVTFNLAAPILFAPKTNRCIQVILEGSPYNTRTPLPAP